MGDVTHVVLIRFIEMFAFSHGDNRNQQEGCVTLMWIAALLYAISIGTWMWLSSTLMLAFNPFFLIFIFFLKKVNMTLYICE